MAETRGTTAAPVAQPGFAAMCLQTKDGRAFRDLLDLVGDKWSLLIIGTLSSGRLRFSELQRCIPGVSQRMLTLKLRSLERDGLVSRTVHAEVPPRVEYDLTAMGRTLIEPAVALATWAITHQPETAAARQAFDEQQE
ncbi:helix-turn-helix domain-containing protein [Streptomyces sp. NPDC002763]|uniref:winged helix-turn-helix transcriptional regulator n=1 Tax=Streptomyces sp. NPDC002763 TaxID=3154427 RepID=UPI0033239B87